VETPIGRIPMNQQLRPTDVTFDEVDGLQCSNCGNYRVEEDSMYYVFLMLNLAFTLSSFGLWLLIWLPLRFIKGLLTPPPTEINVKCKICGKKWVHKLQ
jgi:hypothetical protein